MSERDVGQLHSADDLIAAVEQYGFLPFFRNEIHGFSIEELCPPELDRKSTRLNSSHNVISRMPSSA